MIGYLVQMVVLLTQILEELRLHTKLGEQLLMATQNFTKALTDLTAEVSEVASELSALVQVIKNPASTDAQFDAAATQIETLVGSLHTAVADAQGATAPPAPPTP